MESVTLQDRPAYQVGVDGRGDSTLLVEEAMPRPVEVVVVESPPSPLLKKRSRVLGRLLEMADEYRALGDVHQALEIYYELVERYKRAPEAEEAADRLMDVARSYEEAGEPHAARAIYERMLENGD